MFRVDLQCMAEKLGSVGEVALQETREQVLSAEGAQAASYQRAVDLQRQLADQIQRMASALGSGHRDSRKLEDALSQTPIVDYIDPPGAPSLAPEHAAHSAPTGIGAPPAPGRSAAS